MSSVEMEEEHSGQREQQVKDCRGACVTGAERIKRQRIKARSEGSRESAYIGLCRSHLGLLPLP